MLRFKKEDGSSYPDWDEKGFYDVFELLQNNTFSRDMLNYDDGEVQNVHYGDVLVKYGDVLDCEKELLPFINSNVSVKKYNAQSYIKDGDIVLADTAEDFTAGKVTEVCNVGDKKILSGLHTMLCRPKEEFAKGFLGHYLNSSFYHKQIVPLLVGTKVYSINKKVIGDTALKIPCVEEQKKISDSLSVIDEKISIQESVIVDLEELKKGTMKKIFNQEIRFRDDNGNEFSEWEEDSLSNLCSYVDYRGKTPKKTEEGIFLVTAKNIRQGYIDYESSKEYISEEDYDDVMHRGLPKIGDVLITTEAPCGYIAQIDRENVALAQRVIKYRGKKNIIDNTFLKYVLSAEKFQTLLLSKATGGTVKGIKGSTLHKLKVDVPCMTEQKKIADCLSALDKKIEAEKKILEEWKQMKKALLQQMFV